MDDQLLPCPFCGTKAELNTASNNRDWMIIGCANVMCLVSPRLEGPYAELSESITIWNRRPVSASGDDHE
jgi:hypothetical protein